MKDHYKAILDSVKKRVKDKVKRRDIIAGALLLLVAAGIFSTPKIVSITTSSTVNKKQLPIYCVETEKPQVALSFDAAWGNSI